MRGALTLCLPVSEWCDNQSTGVAQVLITILKLSVGLPDDTLILFLVRKRKGTVKPMEKNTLFTIPSRI